MKTSSGQHHVAYGDRKLVSRSFHNANSLTVTGGRSALPFPMNPRLDRRVYNPVVMAVPRVVTADDLRSQLGHELDKLRTSEDVLFVSKRGRLAAVLIDVERYRELVDRAEFLEDSLAALQAREEVDQAVPWSKVRK